MAEETSKKHPIQKHEKTFEEHHRGLVTDLKASTSHEADSKPSGHVVSVEDFSWVRSHPDWFPQLNSWIDQASRRMSSDLSDMPQNFFTLQPLEVSDMGSGDAPNAMKFFDRHMDKLRNEMEESIKAMNVGATDEVAAPSDGPAGELGYLTNAYEPGRDGHLHFKVRYNVQDFLPEDVEVTMRGNWLVVHGKKTDDVADGGVRTREFCRTVVVPENVNKDHFHASLTSDGVLVVDAPLKEPDYSVYKFDGDRKLCLTAKPHEEAPAGMELAITGNDGAVVMGDAEHRKLHLEVPVDSHLGPKDITIRMDANRLHISGTHVEKHDQKTATAEVHSLERAHFSRTYAIPRAVDACSATAIMKDHRLVLEAPFLKL
ncbi:unnamed protein product [Dibothriocephalus latus]|uniref:SHSP domain-containing protein n=1 Tax=Dibothriocephalus latus TaxID=60516 RepID=A0A3P7N6G6_DIBLA|nr:unnamed protein product [Dibothriocephalus latus]